MLNEKWLKISMIIPAIAIIHCLVLFIFGVAKRLFPFVKLFMCMFVCAISYALSMVFCALLFKLLNSFVSIDSSVIMPVLVIIAGYVMNLAFYKYYKASF
ncbi:MAG: hypothetical protein IJ398_03310 [Clostridia bacterium]|nr:hypothetical protein [Clostridia bacterium]